MTDQPISVAIPDGYTAIPLGDIAAHTDLIHAIDGGARPGNASFVSAIATLLESLVANGTRYCGVGAHLLPDGDPLYSCLTVTVTDAVGGPRNPRLVLADLVQSRSADNTLGLSALVETDTHPVLFTEKVGSVIPRQCGENPAVPAVYQLQAVVPSDDGNSMVAIEFSTPDADRGIACRKMIADMARSVVFRFPAILSLDLP
ncbi:hypothetical protein ACFYO7_07885 [Nocardia salmonicida]|uniref:hypothetical protein n=1 Tax=Nocardia salmonicida TaxID=53431 RepID=UPI00367C0A9C